MATKTWPVPVGEPWYSFLQSGKKKYEGRRFTASVKKFKVGDNICFRFYDRKSQTIDEKRSFTKKIKAILHFPTFMSAMETLPLEDILPEVATAAEGKLIYEQFVSQKTQETDGVVMIQVE